MVAKTLQYEYPPISLKKVDVLEDVNPALQNFEDLLEQLKLLIYEAVNGHAVDLDSFAYGQDVGIAPDGSGNDTIAHGLSTTPIYANVRLLGGGDTDDVEVESLDGTNITVRVYNTADGTDVTSGTFTVMWEARP